MFFPVLFVCFACGVYFLVCLFVFRMVGFGLFFLFFCWLVDWSCFFVFVCSACAACLVYIRGVKLFFGSLTWMEEL